MLLVAHAALRLVAAWKEWLRLGLAERFARGERPSADELPGRWLMQGTENALDATWVLLAVLFLVWLFRANRNLRAFGVEHLRFTPGWSVGWFFVPILNLWKPYQVVKEIRDQSGPGGQGPWHLQAGSPVVGLWWTAFLVANAHGLLSGFAGLAAPRTGGFESASQLMLVSDLLWIPAVILALLVITSIHRLQERMRVEAAFE